MWELLKENGFLTAVVTGTVGLFFAYLRFKLFREAPEGPRTASGAAPDSAGLGKKAVEWA